MLAMPARISRNRSGTAAVEMAVLLPFLLALLLGVWEVGRMIYATQVLDQATREAARLAASGAFTASNNFPTMTSPPSTNTGYEVQRRVILYIQAAGITNTNGITITVANTTQGITSTWTQGTSSYTSTPSSPGSDPAANANNTVVDMAQTNPTIPALDTMTVTVNIPYSNFSWDQMNWFGLPNTITQTMTFCALKNWPLPTPQGS